jgi:tyrosyl-tRNA synthetase
LGGTVWLDAAKTSPYDFYQYFRNVNDGVVRQYLLLLTQLPIKEAEHLASAKDADINRSKEILAYEVTKIVHGEEEAEKAQNASRALFSGATATDAPTAVINTTDLADGISLIDMMLLAKLDKSKSDARRTIQQGGLTINREKVNPADVGRIMTNEDFIDSEILMQKGKKTFCKIVLS